MKKDLIIIGAGPAGLAAAIYACRARLDVLLLEKMASGGQILNTEKVENYPGFPEGISGYELGMLFEKQAKRFGLEMLNREVQQIKLAADNQKILVTDEGEITAAAIIFATGANSRKLEISGEQEFTGRGVSYCATCDGAFFREKTVYVIGGGDAAVEEGLFLTHFASKVYLVHRREQLRATQVLQERVFTNPKMEVIWNTAPTRIEGNKTVEKIVLKNLVTAEEQTRPADGVFIYVGMTPNTSLLTTLVKLDEQGFILTNENMATNVPGIFAAGDIRQKLLRQVITATADGAIAAFAAQKYLETLSGGRPA